MIQSHHINLNNYPERYNQNLLQKSRLTLSENNKIMKKLNLINSIKIDNLNKNLYNKYDINR